MCGNSQSHPLTYQPKFLCFPKDALARTPTTVDETKVIVKRIHGPKYSIAFHGVQNLNHGMLGEATAGHSSSPAQATGLFGALGVTVSHGSESTSLMPE